MKASLIIWFILLGVPLHAQTDSLQISPWHIALFDTNDQLYLALANGDLERRSTKDDDHTLVYSPVKKARLTLLDVTNPLRPFLFYEDLQEYVILDRFLTESGRYSLLPYTSYAGIAAPALNNQIWLVDMVDFSIKKVDPQFEQVQIRIPLPQIIDPGLSDFTYLREYQNLLFLVDDASGVYVFDNLGNILHHMEADGLEYLHFYGSDYYYQLKDYPDQLFGGNIYSGEKSEFNLPLSGRSVFMREDHFWIFQDAMARKVVRP